MLALPQGKSGCGSLDVARYIIIKTGDILVERFQQPKQVSVKGKSNLVTDVDLAAEKQAISLLQAEFPGHNILSEETTRPKSDSEFTWVLDPLDGTNNYTFGIPFFCTTLALLQGEDIVLGLIYDPIRKELFQAVKGGGATVNGKPMAVSAKTKLDDTFVGFDIGYNAQEGTRLLQMACALWPRVHAMRVMGSAALGLAYAACGRLDVYYHRWLYPWDIASGILLTREAGGEVIDWEGKPASHMSRGLIASNGKLARLMLDAAGAI